VSLNLTALRYAIFGLGDRGYPEFNAFARQLDQQLASLGAVALAPRVEADVDYEDLYAEWESQLFARLAGLRAELQSA
jgi:sulfite reductase (NADPH) flavoprotein alpha-component